MKPDLSMRPVFSGGGSAGPHTTMEPFREPSATWAGVVEPPLSSPGLVLWLCVLGLCKEPGPGAWGPRKGGCESQNS